MGLGETSNFSIFTFSCASDLKVCTHSYSNFLSRDEVLRFEWKSLQNDVTLRYSIDAYQWHWCRPTLVPTGAPSVANPRLTKSFFEQTGPAGVGHYTTPTGRARGLNVFTILPLITMQCLVFPWTLCIIFVFPPLPGSHNKIGLVQEGHEWLFTISTFSKFHIKPIKHKSWTVQ